MPIAKDDASASSPPSSQQQQQPSHSGSQVLSPRNGPSPPRPSPPTQQQQQSSRDVESFSPVDEETDTFVSNLPMGPRAPASSGLGGPHARTSRAMSTISSSSQAPPPRRMSTARRDSVNPNTPQFLTVASTFNARPPRSRSPSPFASRLRGVRHSIDVRTLPSYLARKRQSSSFGSKILGNLVEVATSPFEPCSPPSEPIFEEPEAPLLSLGERVAWLMSGAPEFGTVKWIGRMPQVSIAWTVGVEFDNAIGNGDGRCESRRYFTAKENYAKFLPLTTLTKVDNYVGRPRSGTLLSRMSVQLKPGQLISVQRTPSINHLVHCALNAPHHINHDVHKPNLDHCLCHNCNHPCAHLCTTAKPKGKKDDVAHMCHFSHKPHNKMCCGGEDLVYEDIIKSPKQSLLTNGEGQKPPQRPFKRDNSKGSSKADRRKSKTTTTTSSSRERENSEPRRRTRSRQRRPSSRTASGRRTSSAPTSVERLPASGPPPPPGPPDNECSPAGTSQLRLKRTGSDLSISSLPSTSSPVEVFIARGALTDESGLESEEDFERSGHYSHHSHHQRHRHSHDGGRMSGGLRSLVSCLVPGMSSSGHRSGSKHKGSRDKVTSCRRKKSFQPYTNSSCSSRSQSHSHSRSYRHRGLSTSPEDHSATNGGGRGDQNSIQDISELCAQTSFNEVIGEDLPPEKGSPANMHHHATGAAASSFPPSNSSHQSSFQQHQQQQQPKHNATGAVEPERNDCDNQQQQLRTLDGGVAKESSPPLPKSPPVGGTVRGVCEVSEFSSFFNSRPSTALLAREAAPGDFDNCCNRSGSFGRLDSSCAQRLITTKVDIETAATSSARSPSVQSSSSSMLTPGGSRRKKGKAPAPPPLSPGSPTQCPSSPCSTSITSPVSTSASPSATSASFGHSKRKSLKSRPAPTPPPLKAPLLTRSMSEQKQLNVKNCLNAAPSFRSEVDLQAASKHHDHDHHDHSQTGSGAVGQAALEEEALIISYGNDDDDPDLEYDTSKANNYHESQTTSSSTQVPGAGVKYAREFEAEREEEEEGAEFSEEDHHDESDSEDSGSSSSSSSSDEETVHPEAVAEEIEAVAAEPPLICKACGHCLLKQVTPRTLPLPRPLRPISATEPSPPQSTPATRRHRQLQIAQHERHRRLLLLLPPPPHHVPRHQVPEKPSLPVKTFNAASLFGCDMRPHMRPRAAVLYSSRRSFSSPLPEPPAASSSIVRSGDSPKVTARNQIDDLGEEGVEEEETIYDNDNIYEDIELRSSVVSQNLEALLSPVHQVQLDRTAWAQEVRGQDNRSGPTGASGQRQRQRQHQASSVIEFINVAFANVASGGLKVTGPAVHLQQHCLGTAARKVIRTKGDPQPCPQQQQHQQHCCGRLGLVSTAASTTAAAAASSTCVHGKHCVANCCSTFGGSSTTSSDTTTSSTLKAVRQQLCFQAASASSPHHLDISQHLPRCAFWSNFDSVANNSRCGTCPLCTASTGDSTVANSFDVSGSTRSSSTTPTTTTSPNKCPPQERASRGSSSAFVVVVPGAAGEEAGDDDHALHFCGCPLALPSSSSGEETLGELFSAFSVANDDARLLPPVGKPPLAQRSRSVVAPKRRGRADGDDDEDSARVSLGSAASKSGRGRLGGASGGGSLLTSDRISMSQPDCRAVFQAEAPEGNPRMSMSTSGVSGNGSPGASSTEERHHHEYQQQCHGPHDHQHPSASTVTHSLSEPRCDCASPGSPGHHHRQWPAPEQAHIGRLMHQLETAIAHGQHRRAAILARELALRKVTCTLNRSRNSSGGSASAGPLQPIVVYLYVEDRSSHEGPIPLQVYPTMSLKMLKLKVERDFGFPRPLQRWILGKSLATNDDASLATYGVASSGCPIFLYLLTPDEASALSGPDHRLSTSNLLLAAQRPQRQRMSSSTTAQTSPPPPAIDWVSPPPPPPLPLSGALVQTATQDERGARQEEEEVVNEGADGLAMPVERLQENLLVLTSPDEYKGEEQLSASAAYTPPPPLLELPKADAVTRNSEEDESSYCQELTSSAVDIKSAELLFDEEAEPLIDSSSRDTPKTYAQLVELDDAELVTNVEMFECPVCWVDVTVGQGLVLRDCLHSFCRECIINAVQFSEGADVKCPFRNDEYFCDSRLQDREVKAVVSAELYELYLRRSVTTAESKTKRSFHCKTPDCHGWAEIDDTVNLFQCPVCGRENCLTCQAIHEAMNCRQYQDQLDLEAPASEEAKKTKELFDTMLSTGEAVRCPQCRVIVMKKWGCDWIKCSLCETEICFVTAGPRWGPKGKGDTSGGCKCMVNGTRCHPKCNYCH